MASYPLHRSARTLRGCGIGTVLVALFHVRSDYGDRSPDTLFALYSVLCTVCSFQPSACKRTSILCGKR